MTTERRGLLERCIRFSIAQRWLMLLLTLACVALGIWSFQRLPIDATPDITNVQVQINTEAPGYSPLESEQRVTFAIETALAGLPRLDYTRSLSRYGLSQVTVVFEDGTDIYFARQQVSERLQQASSRRRAPRSRATRARASKTAARGRRPTCVPCRTGSCARSCATRRA